MKTKQCRGSLTICEGFAFPISKSKSLDFRLTEKHACALSICDTGEGKPLADCFALFAGDKICSVATASFLAPPLPRIGTTIIGSLDGSAQFGTSNFSTPPETQEIAYRVPVLKISSSSETTQGEGVAR